MSRFFYCNKKRKFILQKIYTYKFEYVVFNKNKSLRGNKYTADMNIFFLNLFSKFNYLCKY